MNDLIADNITYIYKGKYQSVKALKEFSFRFIPGKFYAILGASGSGKTTLLSLLAGLDVPTEGIVSFDGLSTKDIDRDEYRMEHVSVIYQNYNLFAHLTVMENAAYTLYIHNVPKKEADAIAVSNLKKVGITEEQMMRFPKTLSGGEQQRIAIARALASGSEIILADEPTGNLDTKNTENVIKILHSLAKDDGRCVIVVTHDLDVAQEADVVLKMSDGKLVDQR